MYCKIILNLQYNELIALSLCFFFPGFSNQASNNKRNFPYEVQMVFLLLALMVTQISLTTRFRWHSCY